MARVPKGLVDLQRNGKRVKAANATGRQYRACGSRSPNQRMVKDSGAWKAHRRKDLTRQAAWQSAITGQPAGKKSKPQMGGHAGGETWRRGCGERARLGAFCCKRRGSDSLSRYQSLAVTQPECLFESDTRVCLSAMALNSFCDWTLMVTMPASTIGKLLQGVPHVIG